MRSQRPEGYGGLGWFVQEYSNVSDDPWGLIWRPSQAFRYQRILRLLLTIPGIHPRVMDIGCATGDFTDLLSKRISQPEAVLGVDFVESAVARARQRFPHINFVRASISSLAETYDRQFDVVSCLEVLYYLERDQQSQALKSIRRVLRNKGYAIFSSFISTPPYFTPAQLMDLISCEFEVVATEVLHLKIINFVEMIGRRVDKLALMISGGKVNGVAARILGRVPFSTVGALEKWSKFISVRSASHTIVLARVVD